MVIYVDKSKPAFQPPKSFEGFLTRVIATDANGASMGILPPDQPEGLHLLG